jgi:hypothetical protein
VSKRSIRLAAVGGIALALGSMAPAMALRVVGVAGVDAGVDPIATVGEVTSVLDTLPVELPAIPALPALPSTTQVLGIPFLLTPSVFGTVNGAILNLDDTVAALNLGGILPECGLVAVASCNGPAAGNIGVGIPVLSEANVLGGGILNNAGVGGLLTGLPVGSLLTSLPVGGILDGGGLGFLGSLLNVSAGAEGSIGLGAVAGLLGSL